MFTDARGVAGIPLIVRQHFSSDHISFYRDLHSSYRMSVRWILLLWSSLVRRNISTWNDWKYYFLPGVSRLSTWDVLPATKSTFHCWLWAFLICCLLQPTRFWSTQGFHAFFRYFLAWANIDASLICSFWDLPKPFCPRWAMLTCHDPVTDTRYRFRQLQKLLGHSRDLTDNRNESNDSPVSFIHEITRQVVSALNWPLWNYRNTV